MSDNKDRFNSVIQALNSGTAEKVKEIVKNPPAKGMKYVAIKRVLTRSQDGKTTT